MIIKVCVGSSCHLKDSYEVIMKLKELVAEHAAEDKIELQASFCHANCVNGVTAKIEECDCGSNFDIKEDGSIMIHRLSVNNVEDIFINKLLPLVN